MLVFIQLYKGAWTEVSINCAIHYQYKQLLIWKTSFYID